MILTCPNCGTQYVVKDGAIPPEGRQVRCAACKHSWHQNPDDNGESAKGIETPSVQEPFVPVVENAEATPPSNDVHGDPAVATAPVENVDEEPRDEPESLAEATLIEPRSGPEAEERAYEEALIENEPVETGGDDEPVPPLDSEYPAEREPGAAAIIPDEPEIVAAPPERVAAAEDHDTPPIAEAPVDDDFSPFADRNAAEPRGRSAVATLAIVVLIIALIAAAFWFLAPAEWKARVGLSDGSKTPLELMITHPDRQKLASGQESLTIAGRVINPTDSTQSIPTIYAQLKSKAGKTIYSWTIAPPAPTLGPRASTSFNSTEVDVPPGGDDLTITLGAPTP